MLVAVDYYSKLPKIIKQTGFMIWIESCQYLQIGLTDLDEIWNGDSWGQKLLIAVDYNSKFPKIIKQTGFVIWIEICQYLQIGLTDFDEIWNGDSWGQKQLIMMDSPFCFPIAVAVRLPPSLRLTLWPCLD